MQPQARIAAAAEILDNVNAGDAAEKALTNWARRSRFAGSGDRAAVRDHVFDALRCRLSFAALGGAGQVDAGTGDETGRALMIGLLRARGDDPAQMLTGEGHALAALTPEEAALCARDLDADLAQLAPWQAFDMPEWIWPRLTQSLNDKASDMAQILRRRAPVFLRVNLAKTTLPRAIATLAEEGIETTAHPLADTALLVESGARRIRNSAAYRDGLVELQDAASQAVTTQFNISKSMKVLDYCAGGGGKALAMAGRVQAKYDVHDADPSRMKDLPDRARRAGVTLRVIKTPKGPYDLVLCDVPCSGSGSWRRAPEGKWRLTPQALSDLTLTQRSILDKTCTMVAEGGTLAYATCSMLAEENRGVIDQFLTDHPDWQLMGDQQWLPDQGGDGFYLAQLTRRRTTA
jgi:16S rRNA (cytosine967-C5)-methyltransferase